MSSRVVEYSYKGEKPVKLVKWNVRVGSRVSQGTVLLLFQDEEKENSERSVPKSHRKLKCNTVGTVQKLVTEEGTTIMPGMVLLHFESSCPHSTVMKDLCAECGADLRQLDSNRLAEVTACASVSMVHSIPELRVSHEQAQQLGQADKERLLKSRKLVLLVDLDQTLIHTTYDNVPPDLEDVVHFQLYGPHSPWYHTRFRPGTKKFLEKISTIYELHICTFGARPYAHKIASILDPQGKLFSHRILSRDECFNPVSKTGNLKALFPCGDSMVCIIDDREDVWNYASNLIPVKPYNFFHNTGDINAPPGLLSCTDKGKPFTSFSISKEKTDTDKEDLSTVKNSESNQEPDQMKENGEDDDNSCPLPYETQNDVTKDENESKISTMTEKASDVSQRQGTVTSVDTSNKRQQGGDSTCDTNPKAEVSDKNHLHASEMLSSPNAPTNLSVTKQMQDESEATSMAGETRPINASEVQGGSEEATMISTTSETIPLNTSEAQDESEEATSIAGETVPLNAREVQDESKEATAASTACETMPLNTSEVQCGSEEATVISTTGETMPLNTSEEATSVAGETVPLNTREVQDENEETTVISTTGEAMPLTTSAVQDESEEAISTTGETMPLNTSEVQGKSEEATSVAGETMPINTSEVQGESEEATYVAGKTMPLNKSEVRNDALKLPDLPCLPFSDKIVKVSANTVVADTNDVETSDQNVLQNTTEDASENSSFDTTNKEVTHLTDDDDDYLLYLEEILTIIHKAYFDMYDQMLDQGSLEIPDLKDVIPYVRRKVLRGVSIVFSGVIPTNVPPEKNRFWNLAKSLGATVTTDIVLPQEKGRTTTHVIAAKLGTAKVNRARRIKGICIVNPDWLLACSERWERVDERLFPLGKEVTIKHPNSQYRSLMSNFSNSQVPKQPSVPTNKVGSDNTCPVYDPVTGKRIRIGDKPKSMQSEQQCCTVPGATNFTSESSESVDKENAVKLQDSYNPLLAFSQEDLAEMDKEVEDACSGEDSDDIDAEELDEVDSDKEDVAQAETKFNYIAKNKASKRRKESDTESSSAESLTGGECPSGWKRRKKLCKGDIRNSECGKDEFGGVLESDGEENPCPIFPRRELPYDSDRSEEDRSSSDDFNESIGSVDEEMAAAVEREFLGS